MRTQRACAWWRAAPVCQTRRMAAVAARTCRRRGATDELNNELCACAPELHLVHFRLGFDWHLRPTLACVAASQHFHSFSHSRRRLRGLLSNDLQRAARRARRCGDGRLFGGDEAEDLEGERLLVVIGSQEPHSRCGLAYSTWHSSRNMSSWCALSSTAAAGAPLCWLTQSMTGAAGVGQPRRAAAPEAEWCAPCSERRAAPTSLAAASLPCCPATTWDVAAPPSN